MENHISKAIDLALNNGLTFEQIEANPKKVIKDYYKVNTESLTSDDADKIKNYLSNF